MSVSVSMSVCVYENVRVYVCHSVALRIYTLSPISRGALSACVYTHISYCLHSVRLPFLFFLFGCLSFVSERPNIHMYLTKYTKYCQKDSRYCNVLQKYIFACAYLSSPCCPSSSALLLTAGTHSRRCFQRWRRRRRCIERGYREFFPFDLADDANSYILNAQM